MEEKELLKHTYLNTIFNAKTIEIKNQTDLSLKKKSDKKVSFALENN